MGSERASQRAFFGVAVLFFVASAGILSTNFFCEQDDHSLRPASSNSPHSLI
jgi:hypothetical protein